MHRKFTLVELLVVIAIIAITTISSSSVNLRHTIIFPRNS